MRERRVHDHGQSFSSGIPPSLRELQAQAHRLASTMAEVRAASTPVPIRRRPWLWRVLWFPVTVRKVERVLHAAGEDRCTRWAAAWRVSLSTVRR